VARNAKKKYKVCVTSFEESEEMFLADDRLKVLHDEFQKKALKIFENHQRDQVQLFDLNSDILNQLTSVSYYFRET